MGDRKIQNSKGFRPVRHLTIAQSSRQPNGNSQKGVMSHRSLKFAASALAIALGLVELGAISRAAGQPIAPMIAETTQDWQAEGDRTT